MMTGKHRASEIYGPLRLSTVSSLERTGYTMQTFQHAYVPSLKDTGVSADEYLGDHRYRQRRRDATFQVVR